MNIRLSVQELQDIDDLIDTKFYRKGVDMGDLFFDAYGQEKGMAQVRNFQGIAFAATRFSAVENFVKNQVGKEKQGSGWLHRGKGNTAIGDLVLSHFQEMAKAAEDLAKKDYAKKMTIAMRLLHAYVDALAAQFAYCKVKGA